MPASLLLAVYALHLVPMLFGTVIFKIINEITLIQCTYCYFDHESLINLIFFKVIKNDKSNMTEDPDNDPSNIPVFSNF